MDADVVPSVGVDICNVPLDKNKKIQLKEVGGPCYLFGHRCAPARRFLPPIP